jgi:NADH-quinone oxidoreductase subunit J
MISHDRPVYCALYFVLVVLSTAGLFLLLEAEFMAFALIIVYAGAILITYMFVLMLSNQPDEMNQSSLLSYDSIPREPASAVAVGFLLLCLISGTVISGTEILPAQGTPQSQWATLPHLSKQFESSVMELEPTFSWPPIEDVYGNLIQFDGTQAFVVSSDGKTLMLPIDVLPRNTQQVGWSLVNDFPVSLELAGVILLMAMFGAAILARRAIELGEQEKRAMFTSTSSKQFKEQGDEE